VLKAVRKVCKKFIDVHLMIEEPEKFAEDFKKAGADGLTVHYEACRHLHRNIQQIKSLGMQAGVVINPHTPVLLLRDILEDVDMVLVMSVNPGFGGQEFIPQTYQKIRELRSMISERGLSVKIEVDGGVTLENAKPLVEAGVDVLVAGNTVFSSANPKETIALLKQA
jgi:ribulose-phosphate 3-epimerase